MICRYQEVPHTRAFHVSNFSEGTVTSISPVCTKHSTKSNTGLDFRVHTLLLMQLRILQLLFGRVHQLQSNQANPASPSRETFWWVGFGVSEQFHGMSKNLHAKKKS
jgi:hypothetical protein